MSAVYRKELRAGFTNMTAAVAIAVMLLTTGLMFRYYNLYNGALTLRYAVSNSSLVFYFAVPLLSMRVFSEERKQKTDQLLLTSPTGIGSIVLGKYLSLVTIFAVPVLVMCLFPVVMTRFGNETLLWDYACIFSFFLMGCAYLSVGMFISSLTESAVISAILCVLFVFSTQMMSSIFPIIGGSALSALIFLVALSGAAGLLVYYMTKHAPMAALTFAALAAALFVLYYAQPEWFSGRTASVLRILDFESHFAETAGGSFAIENAVFFLSYAVGGIVLTAVSLGRKRWI